MYGIALSVAACVRAGTRVDVAWVVDTDGLRLDRSEALALTPGGGRLGVLASGALDGQLADVAERALSSGRLVDLVVTDTDATAAGLAGGGRVRCLVVPAAQLPGELWPLLLERQAVCVVARLDDDEVVETAVFTADDVADAGPEAVELFARATSDSTVAADGVLTVLWPVPQLVVVGSGAIPSALEAAAGLLGWRTVVVDDAGTATGLIAGLAELDNVVVASHELTTAGRALAAALESPVGYIGAVGSRRMRDQRADWLAYRGHVDLERIHGPAGLDIGARTPAEIAVSILAEAVAVSSSRMSA